MAVEGNQRVGSRNPAARERRAESGGGADGLIDRLTTEADRACLAALTLVDPVGAVAESITRLSEALAISPWRAAAELLERSLADGRLHELPPGRALEAHASILTAATLARDVSFWELASGRPELVAASGGAAGVEACAARAERAVRCDRPVTTGGRELVLALPIRSVGLPCGALVLREIDPAASDEVEKLAARAARLAAPLLERRRLLERSEAREQLLLGAVERRLVRMGYDLHDGPLQEVVVLAQELRLAAADVGELVTAESRAAVSELFAHLEDGVRRLESGLRETAGSLETSAIRREPLGALVARECTRFERETGIGVTLAVDDDATLTDSQGIALYRGLQEALSNVRAHSGAAHVHVTLAHDRGATRLTVADDGRGFEFADRAGAAASIGRLGLVGIAERVRLLGGAFEVSSSPGGGTVLRLALPHWAPAAPGAP